MCIRDRVKVHVSRKQSRRNIFYHFSTNTVENFELAVQNQIIWRKVGAAIVLFLYKNFFTDQARRDKHKRGFMKLTTGDQNFRFHIHLDGLTL